MESNKAQGQIPLRQMLSQQLLTKCNAIKRYFILHFVDNIVKVKSLINDSD